MHPIRDTTGVAPRFATPRTPGRPSYGAAIAKVAAAMGKPLQPWQRQVVDVGTEMLDDGTWAYDTVVVHVQRQGGKTTLVLPMSLHRTLIRNRVKTWFTAQKRQDARDTWLDCAEIVAGSPLGELIVTRKSNGSEALTAPNGSTFRVFAPNEDALHGKANELVTVDEGWAFDGAEGAALQQAIIPTFATTGGQLWLPSTAGTANSTWYRGYVNRGRGAVTSGATTGLAYFEWSLDEAAGDVVLTTMTEIHRHPDGPQAAVESSPELAAKLDHALGLVLAAHPGQYVRPASVRSAALGMPPGEFVRAYGNVWTLTADRVIADHAWTACRDKHLDPPEPGELSLSFDVTSTRSHGAIGGAWRTASGLPAVDVLDARPGTSWLVERIEQLARRYRVDEIGCDGAGPALDIADELERRGWKVRRITGREYVASCAGFLAAVDGTQLQHRGTAALDAAVAAAAKRELGDTWVWGRRQSAGPIAGLVAVTVALWTYDHRAAPIGAPVVVAHRRPEPAPTPAAAAPAPRSSFLTV